MDCLLYAESLVRENTKKCAFRAHGFAFGHTYKRNIKIASRGQDDEEHPVRGEAIACVRLKGPGTPYHVAFVVHNNKTHFYTLEVDARLPGGPRLRRYAYKLNKHSKCRTFHDVHKRTLCPCKTVTLAHS